MKISDFKLAEFFIRNICKSAHCDFVDLKLEFGEKNELREGSIVIANHDKFGQTIFQIVATYLTHLEQIAGSKQQFTNEEKQTMINTVVAVIRDFTYDAYSLPESRTNESVATRLNRDPFVFLVMRDLICPLIDKPVKNIKVIAAKSPYVDGARLIQDGDIPTSHMASTDFPFIFVNMSLESPICRSAFLLVEAIKGHDADPRIVIHDLLSKDELYRKFTGLAKIAYVDDNVVNNFLTILCVLVSYENSESVLLKNKSAKWTEKAGLYTHSQSHQSNDMKGSFWYLALIEKLLEPSRGMNWDGYMALEPLSNDLWAKVEEEKKRRGLDPLPMELLLRVQSDHLKQNPNLIIQGLLSDARVW